jgi:hypothetical protein
LEAIVLVRVLAAVVKLASECHPLLRSSPTGRLQVHRFGREHIGDMLLFMAGPRFGPSVRWRLPYIQLLVRGVKVRTEEMDPAKTAAVETSLGQLRRQLDFTDHVLYTRPSESTAFAVSFGTGLSRKLNEALAWQVGSVKYTHIWIPGRLG